MLVLSRRIGESLKIGDDIELTILGVNGGQVRIGIAAPADVNIVRSELLDRKPPNETPPDEPPAARHPYTIRRRSY